MGSETSGWDHGEPKRQRTPSMGLSGSIRRLAVGEVLDPLLHLGLLDEVGGR